MSQSTLPIGSPSAGHKVPAFRLALAGTALLLMGVTANAATISPNTGSLGASANGSNAATVTTGPGAVFAGNDLAAVYPTNASGTNTTVPFLPALNPAVASPFSVEFWARPTATDDDDAVVANRVSAGNRSGWVFFQRAAGWNFRMYNGVGSGLSTSLTGGTSTLNSYSHVVATWNGTVALLYVNGVLASSTNDQAVSGTYVPNSTVALTAGTLADQSSPYVGSVDELAFYGSALTPARVLLHFSTASSVTPNAYYSLVQGDGALLQLSNVPEPSSLVLLAGGSLLLLLRRRSARSVIP